MPEDTTPPTDAMATGAAPNGSDGAAPNGPDGAAPNGPDRAVPNGPADSLLTGPAPTEALPTGTFQTDREIGPSGDEIPVTKALAESDLPQSGRGTEKSGAYWNTVEASGEFQPGQLVFNRYIVQQKIGRGGMGAVWLVTHRELNTDRALKTIVAGIAYDGQARARFRREAQVMAQFSHPNAVTVHDARLTESDVAYIDMEFVQGRSLDKEIQRGTPMPLPWIARVLDQLCDVLQVAHDKGIVHRDLKPANLMLLDGRPAGREHLKVLDFGIAKILSDVETDGAPHTMTGMFMGTPPYASPEQSDGKADTRADVYAVGVMLYEFLTGFRPFTGPPQKILVDTIMQPPPPFAKANPAVQYPPEVESLVMQCLAKKPEDRIQTAREVAERFRAALPGLEPSEDVGKSKFETRGRRTSEFLPIAIVCTMLAIVALVFGKPYFSRRPEQVNPPPPPPVLVLDGWDAEPKAELDEYRRPKILVPVGKAGSSGIRMISIPGGRFSLGDDPKNEVEVADFAMSETEVTNGQMLAYFKATSVVPPAAFEKAFQTLIMGGNAPGIAKEEAELHPAVGISHTMAQDYARWLNADLPSDIQWEYAARSRGLPGRIYVWPDTKPLKNGSNRANIDSLANFDTTTLKVRSFQDDRTEQGIYDLAGNVREWTRTAGNAPGQVLVRGESWKGFCSDYSNFRSRPLAGTEENEDLGFRIVVDLPKPAPTPEL